MLLTNKLPVYYPKMILSIANSKVHCNAVLIHTLWNETRFQSSDPANVQIEEMNNKIVTAISYSVYMLCSVANVHVTRVLSVDWMVQPNHGQQAIFKKSVLTQAIHLYRNSQMDRLTGNYDVIYRACTMTDREGQSD